MKWQGTHTVDCYGGVCWWLAGRNTGVCFPQTAQSSARLSEAEVPWGAKGTSCQETSPYPAFAVRITFLATDLRLPPASAYRPVLQSFFKLFPLQSSKYPQHLQKLPALRNFIWYEAHFSGSLMKALILDGNLAGASSISKDPVQQLVQISWAMLLVTWV